MNVHSHILAFAEGAIARKKLLPVRSAGASEGFRTSVCGGLTYLAKRVAVFSVFAHL